MNCMKETRWIFQPIWSFKSLRVICFSHKYLSSCSFGTRQAAEKIRASRESRHFAVWSSSSLRNWPISSLLVCCSRAQVIIMCYQHSTETLMMTIEFELTRHARNSHTLALFLLLRLLLSCQSQCTTAETKLKTCFYLIFKLNFVVWHEIGQSFSCREAHLKKMKEKKLTKWDEKKTENKE